MIPASFRDRAAALSKWERLFVAATLCASCLAAGLAFYVLFANRLDLNIIVHILRCPR